MFFDSITNKLPVIKAHCYKKIQMCVFFWCYVCDFLNLSIFVQEYKTRRLDTSYSKERYVTKPQTLLNNMQKTRPQYLNLERFHWRSVFAHKKNNTRYYRRHTLSLWILQLDSSMSDWNQPDLGVGVAVSFKIKSSLKKFIRVPCTLINCLSMPQLGICIKSKIFLIWH